MNTYEVIFRRVMEQEGGVLVEASDPLEARSEARRWRDSVDWIETGFVGEEEIVTIREYV